MPIVFCSLDIHMPSCHSLKEKRRVINKASDRLRSRFNFSISEIQHQDLWQRARLGAVSIGPNQKQLEQFSEKLVRETERILGSDLLRYKIDIFDYD